MEGSQQRAIDHSHEAKTMAHSVKIRGFTIGDPFHKQQLSVKHFSETVMGKIEKGCHQQIHYRKIIQTNSDMYIRDPQVYMSKAKEILGEHTKLWIPKPTRELDTHWGSNGRACKNILEGLHIVNDRDNSFWVLLFKELAS